MVVRKFVPGGSSNEAPGGKQLFPVATTAFLVPSGSVEIVTADCSIRGCGYGCPGIIGLYPQTFGGSFHAFGGFNCPKHIPAANVPTASVTVIGLQRVFIVRAPRRPTSTAICRPPGPPGPAALPLRW